MRSLAPCLRVTLIAGVVAFSSSAPPSIASSTFASGRDSPNATAALDVSVKVPKVMRLRLVDHPATIDVTNEDLERGVIRIAGPSLDIAANDRRGYLLQAQLRGTTFTAVRIGMPASECTPGPEGCILRMPSMVGKSRPGPTPVTYELALSRGAVAGRYAWPVALSLVDP